MLNEREKLMQIIHLGMDLAQFKDVDILLERILTLARQFVNAEAGSIYVREGNQLNFTYTQNEVLEEKLAPGKKLIYANFSIPIDEKSIAGVVGKTQEMLNIPDVYQLPTNLPYAFNKDYDQRSGYRTHSMLAFPLTLSTGKLLGVLQLINARDKNGRIAPFEKEDESYILHFANNAAMAMERAQMTRALILRAIKMAELRDPNETGPHANRVAAYAVEIYDTWASRRGSNPEELIRMKDALRMGAMLHDVGKIAIPDVILKKPAKLTPEEFDVIKTHPAQGAKLFSELYSEFDTAAYIISLTHHERWDGLGYPGFIDPLTGKTILGHEGDDGKPLGKKGEEIPPFGRVVAIADVYDALSRRRAYKEPWDESRVLETLQASAGKHFDPEMIDAFFSNIDIIRNISKKYPDAVKE